jgi:hypothetical protein
MGYSDPQKHREYQRAYWRKKNKGVTEIESTTSYDQYTYRLVPKTWRKTVNLREPYTLESSTSPLIMDLLAGKTLLIDYEAPLGAKDNPFRTLYNYFSGRGYKLHTHITDDVDRGEYRKLLMWCEPLLKKKAS